MAPYNPHRSARWNYGGSNWKLSRAKIDLFLTCRRCFYLDNALGTKRPPFPTFSLNNAVDELLKREFDGYRTQQRPHPIMEHYGIAAKPFSHEHLAAWRDPFVGLQYLHPATGMTVSGGVDDLWVDDSGSIIVADYKATAKDHSLESLEDVPAATQYQRQLSVYQWLLKQQGFAVSNTAYLVYANAKGTEPSFSATLTFELTLVPVEGETEWIEPILHEIYECLNKTELPEPADTCEYCAYREVAGKKLRAVHFETDQRDSADLNDGQGKQQNPAAANRTSEQTNLFSHYGTN
jgi:CRISPR/Cas system-associated exonuclease Cas4 (RecB family)